MNWNLNFGVDRTVEGNVFLTLHSFFFCSPSLHNISMWCNPNMNWNNWNMELEHELEPELWRGYWIGQLRAMCFSPSTPSFSAPPPCTTSQCGATLTPCQLLQLQVGQFN